MDYVIIGIVALIAIAAGFAAGCYFEQHKQGILSAAARVEKIAGQFEQIVQVHIQQLAKNTQIVAATAEKIVQSNNTMVEDVKAQVATLAPATIEIPPAT